MHLDRKRKLPKAYRLDKSSFTLYLYEILFETASHSSGLLSLLSRYVKNPN